MNNAPDITRQKATANDQLAICIPTFKRPAQLAACVHSVILSAEPHAVPIQIVDDSADDTNVETVKQLQARYTHIRYHRNPENLGIDLNILNAVNLCACRYAWLLGEDDRILPDAVRTMLKKLETRPVFVFANYSTVNEEVTAVLREEAIAIPGDPAMDANTFLSHYGWAAGFIGACVIDKTLWGTAPQKPYVGTYFAHVGVIFHYLQGRNTSTISRPIVLNRCGTPETFTWRKETFEVLGGWARLMDLLRPLYGNDICDKSLASFEKAHGLGTLRFLLYTRAGGVYDIAAYRKHIRPSRERRAFKICAWLIARSDRRITHSLHRLLSHVRALTRRKLIGY